MKENFSKEELESIKLISFIMTEENIKKGLNAEKIAKYYLKEEVQKGNLDKYFDMRYRKKLTNYNTRLMNALEGRDFNKLMNYESHRDKYPERIRLTKNKRHKRGLLEDLEHEIKGKKGNRKAKKIISELKFRFRGLDGYEFKRLLGDLLGTKFDWMGVKDGKTILFETKSRFWLYEKEVKLYKRFSRAGIPFFLLLWDDDKGELRSFDMKKFKFKEWRNQLGGYTIPREETQLIKRFSEEST